jgi:uncharacterized protein (TIGR02145 family)
LNTLNTVLRKAKSLLTVVALIFAVNTFGQKLSVDFTFTAINNAVFVQLDSIKVMNRSKGGESMIYYPDTTLSLEITSGDTLLYIGYSTGYPIGIQEMNQNIENFHVVQNFPNPVKDHTVVSLYIPEKGTMRIMVSDMLGREVNYNKWMLDKGYHSFRLSPGNGNLFFLTASWNGISRSIKILTIGSGSGNTNSLDYIGTNNKELQLKASSFKAGLIMKESGILDAPDANKSYTFQFATNIPCPGMPTVTYEGQVYNTIQIFSQCWLKENLNVGTVISGNQDQTNNGIIEKYCYNNLPDSCAKYGGLYQWDEMMQYKNVQGGQGICPSRWHLPTDEEWKVLEGAVDSHVGIGDPIWDYEIMNRGYDAGSNLKSTTGWKYEGNGSDVFGFSGLPGGIRFDGGLFYTIVESGGWWTSSEHFNGLLPWYRFLNFGYTDPTRGKDSDKSRGYSVRCIMDQ